MNWDCIVCGDDYSLNPQPSRNKGYGTINTGQDVKFICPVDLDKIEDHIEILKQRREQFTTA